MEGIIIKKDRLIEIMTRNRTLHAKMFDEAQEGYRELMTGKLVEAMVVFKDKDTYKEYPDLAKLVRDNPAPISYVAQYDQVLEMLPYHAKDTVELDQQQFTHFIKDDWHWKTHFISSTSTYSKGKW